MECNCNNNSNGAVIPWVRGNRLPLVICVYEDVVTQEGEGSLVHNEMERVPYEIQAADTVTVVMKSGFRQVEMPFTTEGNKVLVTDNGELAAGTYTVEVTIVRGDGARGRWQETRQVRVYENTSDAQLGEMYAIEADLFFYAKGDTGNGIADITANADYTLTITMTDGTTYTTETVKGEKGDKGDKGDTGTSIVSFEATGQTDVSVVYTVTFSDDTTQEVAVPKGPQGDTGLTGNGIASTTLNNDYTLTVNYTDGTSYTTPSIRGAQGVQGVSIIAFTQTGETSTNTLYNVVFSDGRTQSVAIPKGLKGDKGDTGNTGSQGVQGPKGDTVTATDYTLYNVQGSDSQGAMSQDATTKAISAQTGYYTCGTAAGTAAKVVTVENGNLYKRTLGGHFKVKMTNANTAASGVTLQVGSETATALWYNGAAVSAQNTWEADEIISVFYDGTRFMASNSQGGGGKAEKISYDNSQSGLAAENVQDALDEVAIESAVNENYCKSGVETRFVQGIVSSSNGNIVNASDNITSVFIDGGCIVTANDGYCIRRAAKYNKTTESYIGQYAADDYSRQFLYLEEGYKYRFTVYAGGTNISPRDNVLEYVKSYSFPYINSVDNPNEFEPIIISTSGGLIQSDENRTFIYKILFEGQLFIANYYLDGNLANRGIWVADDKNGTNITRKSTSATIGYHSDKYCATKSDVGKYIFICGKHGTSSNYILNVGYVSNGVDTALDSITEEVNNLVNNIYDELEIAENVTISDYIYSGWTTDSNHKWKTGTSCIIIPVKSAKSVTITANNNYNAQYVFLKTASPISKTLLDVSTGSTLTIVYAGTTADVSVPNDAAFMFMFTTLNNTDRVPSSVVIHRSIKESFVLEQSAMLNGVVSDKQWIKIHAYLSITNKKFAANSYTYSKYINVKEGDNFTIIADEGYDCEWATLESIPNLTPHLLQSNSVRCGRIASGRKINLTINTNETVLLLNLNTSQNTYDGTVRYSSNHLESGEIPVVCIPVYGQSLAVGGDAPRITNAAKFPLITFNTELLINDFSQTQETAKFGLLDSYVESLCIDRCIGQGNVGSSIMSFSFGQGSRSITLLKKGTTLYTQFLAKIQAAYDIVGSSLVVPAFCWIQGEDDRFGTYTDDYKGELLQLRADLDADIKAITGQTQDVHCIVYQTNQLSIGDVTPGHFVPDSYNSGDYGGLMTVPTAQYELIRDNPYFHAATPIYYMKFAVSANGRTIHINSESQKVMGFYCGLAAERVTEGLADIGLYVQSVTKVDSTHIQLVLHTPCPPIVIDTQQVYEVDGYGFSVITPNNTNILQSVEVKPNHWSEQVINITTSEDCTNAKVRYGCNGVIAGDSDGYARGSRGNIRDSQGLQYFATVNGKQIPMHNWLYFGEWLIS